MFYKHCLFNPFPLPGDMHHLFSLTQHVHTGPTLKVVKNTITVQSWQYYNWKLQFTVKVMRTVAFASQSLWINAQYGGLAELSA